MLVNAVSLALLITASSVVNAQSSCTRSTVTATHTVYVSVGASSPQPNFVTQIRSSPSTTAKTSTTKPSTAPTSPANTGTTLKTDYTGPTSGRGTHYADVDQGGNCMLAPRKDTKFVAILGPIYDNAAYCGGCIEVTGDKGKTVVQITNKCPECKAGDLDLSIPAFNQIISTDGVGQVSWKFVSCVAAGLETGKITYWWKSGSSQYWSALQVRGGDAPIRSVEVKPAGSSTFQKLPRQDYNFFLASSGLGPGPFQVRTTFQDGSVQTDTNIPLNGNIGG